MEQAPSPWSLSDVSTGYFFVINCRPQLQTAADIRPADCSRLSTAADWRSCIFYPRQPTGRQKELVLHKQVRHSHPDNTFNIHSSRILLSFYGQEFQGSCWSIGVFHIPYSQSLVFIFPAPPVTVNLPHTDNCGVLQSVWGS